MAIFTVPTGDASAQTLWQSKVFLESYFSSFWGKYMTNDATSPVYAIRDLQKNKGETVSFDMFARTVDEIITDGNVEGHESSMTKYAETVTLAEFDVALKYREMLDAQRPAWNISDIARKQLDLRGAEMIDKIAWDALQNASHSGTSFSAYTKTIYVNDRANNDALVAGDTLDPQTMVQAAIWASHGGDRGQPPIQPIKVGGRDTYILLVYPDCCYDLRFDSTYNEWLRTAEQRGKENPLFKDAQLVISSGVGEIAVVPHPRVSTTTNTGSIPVCRCALLGQQAISYAFGQGPTIIKHEFPYKKTVGYDFTLTAGAVRTTFNSKAWGVMGLNCAYTDISAL